MLEKNLEAIEDQMVSEYLEKIRKARRDDWVELIKSRDGLDNLLIHHGARTVPAYDLDDTLSLTKQQADFLSQTTRRTVTVLMGMGLGYTLNEMTSQLKEKSKKHDREHRIVVVEPCLWMIKQAFKRFDFSPFLEKKVVIIASEIPDVAVILTALDYGLVIENWIMSVEPYIHHKMDIYKGFIEFTASLINQMRCNVGTVMSAGGTIADNDIANLPYVIRHRGVNELKDLFQGKPAVLVSTGPSLKKNVHLLREYQDKVIIIAVAQALRILLAYDIRPDFITTVDFGEVNMVHLRGLMDSDVPLICLNKTYAPLLHSYQGPRFITASPNPGYEDKSHGILTNKGSLEAGGSVAHLSFSAAVTLGCNPIILIGQDLALTDGQSHFAQADAGGRVEIGEDKMIRWKVGDQRCHLSNIEGGQFSMGSEFWVEGYFGGNVLTNMGLASFITSFEGMFRNLKTIDEKREIINATQGGARIRECRQMSLKRALQLHTSTEIDKSPLLPLLSLADDADQLIEKVIPLLEEDLQILKQIAYHARRGIRLASKMLSSRNWDKLKRLFQANRYHSLEAEKLAKQLPLVGLAIYGASRTIQYSEYQVKLRADVEHLKKDREDLKIRVKRNKHILKAAQDAAVSLRKTYSKTLSILQEYQKTKDDILLSPYIPDEKPDLSDAERYFDHGNFARPLLIAKKIATDLSREVSKDELERAIQVAMSAKLIQKKLIKEAEEIDEDNIIEANELVQESWRVGREKKDYDKSLSLLEKARELDPKNEIVLWGLATTYHHTNRFRTSISLYKELISLCPDKPKYLFELGQVQLKTGEIQEGLEAVQKAMEQTDEFDSFLWVVGEICREGGLKEKALLAFDTYLEKFPADYKVMEKKAHLLKEMGRPEEGDSLLKEAREIRGK